MDKIVLAYSGGLDTTVAIHWLKNVRRLKVIALACNLGQGRDLDEAGERAIAAGAEAVHVVDLRRTFLKKFCFRALRADAKYEGVYLLSAALSRPLIATELVRLAVNEGANIVGHGAPPRGNDQFRLECSVAALDPQMQIIAPLREWKMNTREEVLQYADEHDIDVDKLSKSIYTRDINLWGARTSGAALRDIHHDAPADVWLLTRSAAAAPDKPGEVTISFEKGEPVAVDGEKLDPVSMMEKLNAVGGEHGVGRLDNIEHSLTGFKIRDIYEAPGATILSAAHEALERLVLDKTTLTFKRSVISTAYAQAVYEGNWFTTHRESLDAYVQSSQEFVTGDVTVQLYKGSVSPMRGHSDFSTYDREQESFHNLSDETPKRATEGMLQIAKMLQINRAFKQRPRL